MAEPEPVQFPRGPDEWMTLVVLVAVFAWVSVAPSGVLFEPPGNDATRQEIRLSAKTVVSVWCVAWPWMLAIGWIDRITRAARRWWAVGCALLLLHFVIAFHAGHGWSHQAAREHTRRVGGYGDGIYVNYLFALVWLVDVIWSWVAFGSYLRRPRWVRWTIAGFMGFIVFNAAVVYGSGIFRVLVLTYFLGLGAVVVASRRAGARR